MQFQRLGETGMSVSRYCLGAMMFGAMGNRDHDECVSMIHRSLDAGINFIDTATPTRWASPRRSWARLSRAGAETM